jgi:hypothetical protein
MRLAAAAGFPAPARFMRHRCAEKRAADWIPEGRSREPVDEPTHYV